jgi:hypothetical protein
MDEQGDEVVRSNQRGKTQPKPAPRSANPGSPVPDGVAHSRQKPAAAETSQAVQRTEPIMFRVRPDLAIAIRREAVERGLSVQTLVLLSLRDIGIPVLDADLEDLRKGGGRKRGDATSLGSAAPAIDQPVPGLSTLQAQEEALVERIVARVALVAPAPAQTVTITNCCCRPGPASTPPVTQNPKTRRKR